MRNTICMTLVQRRYQSAVRKGRPEMALHWHKKLTALYINAEWEVKQDMLCTINQLESNCAFLETRRSILDMFTAFSFVLGVVYHDSVVEIGTRILDFVYGMVII